MRALGAATIFVLLMYIVIEMVYMTRKENGCQSSSHSAVQR